MKSNNAPEQQSNEKQPPSRNLTPFTKALQNLANSPFPPRLPPTRTLNFNDDPYDLDIINQNLSPLPNFQSYPRITKGFQEERVCKRLDFAPLIQRSPISISKVQIHQSPLPSNQLVQHTARKPQSIYMSPRAQLQFNEFNTEQRRWQEHDSEDDLECEEEDFEVDQARQDNICMKCHNTYSKSPHKDEQSHNHPPLSFGELPSLLGSTRKQQQVIQLESKRGSKPQSLITLKKPTASVERKTENIVQLKTEQRRPKITEHYSFQQTVRKRPRKGGINPILLSVVKPDIKCNCNKSKCLKLYCDCFAAGQICGRDCNCSECSNNDEHNHDRKSAMKQILDRNPNAFRPKVQQSGVSEDDVKHFKGCNCKKSNCLKKYCECYQMNVKCSELCKCDGCKNCDTPQQSRKKSRRYEEPIHDTRQKKLKIY